MMKINKINTLPKRYKKREDIKLGAQRMNNEDIDEVLEEIYREDKLDIEFDI